MTPHYEDLTESGLHTHQLSPVSHTQGQGRHTCGTHFHTVSLGSDAHKRFVADAPARAAQAEAEGQRGEKRSCQRAPILEPRWKTPADEQHVMSAAPRAQWFYSKAAQNLRCWFGGENKKSLVFFRGTLRSVAGGRVQCSPGKERYETRKRAFAVSFTDVSTMSARQSRGGRALLDNHINCGRGVPLTHGVRSVLRHVCCVDRAMCVDSHKRCT